MTGAFIRIVRAPMPGGEVNAFLFPGGHIVLMQTRILSLTAYLASFFPPLREDLWDDKPVPPPTP